MKRLLIISLLYSYYALASFPIPVERISVSPQDCNGSFQDTFLEIKFARDLVGGVTIDTFPLAQNFSVTANSVSIASAQNVLMTTAFINDSLNNPPTAIFYVIGGVGGTGIESAVLDNIEVDCDGVGNFQYEVLLLSTADITLESVRLLFPSGKVVERMNPETSGMFSDLTETGSYQITFTPSAGEESCSNPLTIQFQLAAVPFMIESVTTTPQTSPEEGTVTVTVSGGIPPYDYTLIDSNGNEINTQSNETTFVFGPPLDAGSYTVEVDDGSFCDDEMNVIIDLLENPAANYIATNAKFGCSVD